MAKLTMLWCLVWLICLQTLTLNIDQTSGAKTKSKSKRSNQKRVKNSTLTSEPAVYNFFEPNVPKHNKRRAVTLVPENDYGYRGVFDHFGPMSTISTQPTMSSMSNTDSLITMMAAGSYGNDFDNLNRKNYHGSTDQPFEQSPIPIYKPVYDGNGNDQSLVNHHQSSSPIDSYLSSVPSSLAQNEDYYNNVGRIPEKYLSKPVVDNNNNYNDNNNNNNKNNIKNNVKYSSSVGLSTGGGADSGGGGYSGYSGSGNYISNSITQQQNVKWPGIESSGELSQYDYLASTTKSPFSTINSAKTAVSHSNGPDESIAANFPQSPDVMRLIPTATVETIPLPPKSEYDIPEIIHNGDHVVRVQKVPVKGIEDAYYNPEIPEIPEDDQRVTNVTRIPFQPTKGGGSRGGTKTRKGGSKQTETSTMRTTTESMLDDEFEGNVNDVIESNDDDNELSSEQQTDKKDEDKKDDVEDEDEESSEDKPKEDENKSEEDQVEEEDDTKKEDEDETKNEVEEDETESTTPSSDSDSDTSTEDSSEESTSSEDDSSSNGDEEDDSSSGSSSTTEAPVTTTTTTTPAPTSKPAYPMYPPPPFPPFMFPPMFPPPYPPPPGFPPMPMPYMPYGPSANGYGPSQKYYPSSQYGQSYDPKPYVHPPVIYSKEPHPQPPAGPPYQHPPVVYSKQPHAQPPAGYPYKHPPVVYSKQPHQQPQSSYPYNQSPVVYSQPPAYPPSQSAYPYSHSPVSYAKQPVPPPQPYPQQPSYPPAHPRPTYPPNIAPISQLSHQGYPPKNNVVYSPPSYPLSYPPSNGQMAPPHPTYPPNVAPQQYPASNNYGTRAAAPPSNYYYPNQNNIAPSGQYNNGKSANYYQKPTEITKNIMICQNNCKDGYGRRSNNYYRRSDNNEETEIKTDIFLGDMISSDSYDEPTNYNQQQQIQPKYDYSPPAPPQPMIYPSSNLPMPQSYVGTKKSGIINSFKKNLANMLPNLKANSGDPYPPLDQNYRSLDGSIDMNEHTERSDNNGEPKPILYPCDENRIGKCVLPQAAASSVQPVPIPLGG